MAVTASALSQTGRGGSKAKVTVRATLEDGETGELYAEMEGLSIGGVRLRVDGSGLPADDGIDARVWSRGELIPGALCDVDADGTRLAEDTCAS